MAQRVKAKSSCCRDSPRCKRCPVVLKRLERAGNAVRMDRRTYVVGKVTKKELKAARVR
jgi:hypothetical protein